MRVPNWKPVVVTTALVVGQGLAIATPATASTGPIVISADMPAAVPAGHNWAFNDFFPRSLVVRQGQTIGFAIQGFHTATLLPKGVSAAQDRKVNGIATADEDLAANPNGTSHIAIDLPAVLPTSQTCGDTSHPCAFDGTQVVSSGAPLAGPPAGPFMVTITASPGTYAFSCRVHPGMQGKITVVAPPANGTSAEDVTEAVTHQVKSDVRAAYKAEARASVGASKLNADGTTTWYISPGASDPARHVAILEFLPQNVTIKPGDTVRWRMRESNEPHTVTFPADLHTDQIPLCESPGGAPDGAAVPTVIPPTGPQDFACPGNTPVSEIEFDGGNGVSSVSSPNTVSDSGTLATSRLGHDFGLPASAVLSTWTVSFDAATPGTYTYVCQIHDGMHGTITIH